MRVRRRSSIAGVVVAVGFLATVVGCSAGLDGTPYRAAEDSTDGKGNPSTPQSSPLDAGGRSPAHWKGSDTTNTTDVTSDAQAYTAPDSGVTLGNGVDASTPPPVSSTPSCSAAAGLGCEDCCFAGIPGANTLNNAIEAEYEDCLNANGCYDDPGCYQFCNDQAQNDQCNASPTLCHLIDNCMAVNNCQ